MRQRSQSPPPPLLSGSCLGRREKESPRLNLIQFQVPTRPSAPRPVDGLGEFVELLDALLHDLLGEGVGGRRGAREPCAQAVIGSNGGPLVVLDRRVDPFGVTEVEGSRDHLVQDGSDLPRTGQGGRGGEGGVPGDGRSR
jgi:hypothetical protein